MAVYYTGFLCFALFMLRRGVKFPYYDSKKISTTNNAALTTTSRYTTRLVHLRHRATPTLRLRLAQNASYHCAASGQVSAFQDAPPLREAFM